MFWFDLIGLGLGVQVPVLATGLTDVFLGGFNKLIAHADIPIDKRHNEFPNHTFPDVINYV